MDESFRRLRRAPAAKGILHSVAVRESLGPRPYCEQQIFSLIYMAIQGFMMHLARMGQG